VADLPTPLEEAPPELSGGRPLFLKREDVHELGAFKWRGALPALEKYRDGGASVVVTASTGNHGAATAWAAERTGMRAVVFVPEDASGTKLALLEQLGADLHRVGADLDASKDLAKAHAADHGLPFFEDGDEPAQLEGYEALGEEIRQQVEERTGNPLRQVMVPIGNGALAIGVARGGGDVFGVVAREAPVMSLSIQHGRAIPCTRAATFADGIAVRVAIPAAVKELYELMMPVFTVSERAIAFAIRDYDAVGIRAEGAAGAALAGYRDTGFGVTDDPNSRRERRLPETWPTVVIVTGRNIDDELHRRCVEDPYSFPD
jgi:threonine dehydratase